MQALGLSVYHDGIAWSENQWLHGSELPAGVGERVLPLVNSQRQRFCQYYVGIWHFEQEEKGMSTFFSIRTRVNNKWYLDTEPVYMLLTHIR